MMLQAAGLKVPRASQAALESSLRYATQPLGGILVTFPSDSSALVKLSLNLPFVELWFFGTRFGLRRPQRSLQATLSKQRSMQMGRSDGNMRRHARVILASHWTKLRA